jgi:ABC-type spermidine/putrescine transport system permease subunit II
MPILASITLALTGLSVGVPLGVAAAYGLHLGRRALMERA